MKRLFCMMVIVMLSWAISFFGYHYCHIASPIVYHCVGFFGGLGAGILILMED